MAAEGNSTIIDNAFMYRACNQCSSMTCANQLYSCLDGINNVCGVPGFKLAGLGRSMQCLCKATELTCADIVTRSPLLDLYVETQGVCCGGQQLWIGNCQYSKLGVFSGQTNGAFRSDTRRLAGCDGEYRDVLNHDAEKSFSGGASSEIRMVI
jgi:hypothetical protein